MQAKKTLVIGMTVLTLSSAASIAFAGGNTINNIHTSGGNGANTSATANVNASVVSNNLNLNNVDVRNSVNSTNLGLVYGVQKLNNGQVISPAQSTSVKVEDTQERVISPTVIPYETPLIQNGKVGDITDSLPRFAAIKPLNKATDTILSVVSVYYGWFLDRIRLEDVERDLLKKCEEISFENGGLHNIRFQVQYKDGASSAGIGGGVAGSGANNSGVGGTLSVLPGYHSSNADPAYVIKFYKVGK